MIKNKKGAALLQVLLVTVVLAGMATMLLRVSLSRATSARKTRRTVSSQVLMQSCMAEVNALWSSKTPQVFARDLAQCKMYCKTENSNGDCTAWVNEFECNTKGEIEGSPFAVKATIEHSGNPEEAPPCKITYTLINGSTL